MDERKIIAVVGATGAQGSGLCRAILNDKSGGFRVRALTRNTGSDKAKELKNTSNRKPSRPITFQFCRKTLTWLSTTSA